MHSAERIVRGKHDDLTQRIIGVFYDVYNELGRRFLESGYRGAMRLALSQTGMKVGCEVPISVEFRGVVIGIFRADLVINDPVLVELRTTEGLTREHESQTLNYLRATRIEVASLMNFGSSAQSKDWSWIMNPRSQKNNRSRSALSLSLQQR